MTSTQKHIVRQGDFALGTHFDDKSLAQQLADRIPGAEVVTIEVPA